MKQYLEHKGYWGSVEFSLEDDCLFGRVEYINDLVSYEGSTVSELKSSFEDAVEDYLATCAAQSKDPDRPFSGTFNIRIGPDLHKKAVVAAKRTNQSLNDYIKQAISRFVDKPDHSPSQHFHVYYTPEQINPYNFNRGGELPWSQRVQMH